MISQGLELLRALLPFSRKRDAKKMREFSKLVMEQYGFLVEQIGKFQRDYFEVSARIKEMHGEMVVLGEQLREALSLRCGMKDCPERWFPSGEKGGSDAHD
ncbi:MAG: hypothetical protein LUD15_11070 [Bacteroides sp.]|nr:hypothetical protein [Bacteroides sp.]